MYARMAAPRAALAGLLSTMLIAGALGGLFTGTARADSVPADATDPATPATVTADALPTVQINGVVWSQVVVGNTVYVAGKFTAARPAGAAVGTNETTRNNLLAYDVRTGALITGFAPDLNGQARVVVASPDGSRIFVGGDFTVANGQPRYRFAAYNTATGALDPTFKPGFPSQVRAIVASGSTVYVGGTFDAVGSVVRNRLAAFSYPTGALLPWAPSADAQVNALELSPSGSKVIVGGSFTTLSGATARGLGAVDASSGAAVPFAAGTVVNNTGSSSAILSLSVDNDTVYASGYTFGPGNLEGVVAADPDTGAVRWIDDCHGDTYSVWASGTAAYVAGHPHVCSNIGGWPQTDPWSFYRGIAFSKAATGTVGTETGNFAGQPAPSLLNWFPTIDAGTYTGQSQGPWSVDGNSQYVVYGGEFPTVNGVAQQGLVRFAVPSIAPNKVGPQGNDQLIPTLTSLAPGTVRVGWQTTWDKDNANLTYRIYRDGDTTTPVYQSTRTSTFWNRPTAAFTDSGLSAGTHRYRLTVTDPTGNQVTTAYSSIDVTAGTATKRPYGDAVLADGAQDHWPLGESSGTTAYDYAATQDATIGTGVTLAQAGAITNDPNTAARFNGSTSGLVATQAKINGPNTFSIEAWVQTTSKTGGKIVGFGDKNTGSSGSYDRHVYMDTSGRILFGVYPGAIRTVTSTARFNDGAWHHVVATLSRSGMALYVDGKLVGSRTDTTTGQTYSGYWRIGGDETWSGGKYFNGRIDEVAIYPTALTADRVAGHYTLGTTGTATNVAPTAAFTSTSADLTASFDAAGSTDPDGTITSVSWAFGDGATATGTTASHTYAAAGTYSVTATVTDDDGATATTTRTVTVTAPVPNVAPTAAFTPTATDLAVTVDGSASADSDGTVAGYAWDFGDGSKGTGATASHTYTEAGTYQVALTVTDDDGATGTSTQAVTVTAPVVPTTFVSDAFGRTATTGLGTADLGGAWSVPAASASVSGGVGHVVVKTAGGSSWATLNGVSQTDVALQASLSLPKMPTGGGTYVYLVSRHVGNSDYYTAVRFVADGRVQLQLTRRTSGSETTLRTVTVPGITYTPGTVLQVRFDTSGTATTTLNAKAWVAGSAEPTAWQATATDTTAALQRAGSVGIVNYVSASATAVPVTVDLDDVWAGAAGTAPSATPTPAPVNSAPTAAFTSTVKDLAVTVDGSASADSDGTVAGHGWDFGDGSTGTGATASHTYTAAGTYQVTLTVTDDKGATATSTKAVAVTAPVVGTVFASDAFERTAATGFGPADLGGAWTVPAASSSVSGGAGHLVVKTAGGSTWATLNGVSQTDVALQAALSLDQVPTGGGTYVYLVSRHVGNTDYYTAVRFVADGRVQLQLTRRVAGVETTLRAITVPGITYTPGTVLQVRFDTGGAGTTTLKAMAWVDGTTEPATWQVTATDTTAALQQPGSIGIVGYVSGSATTVPVTVNVADLWAGAAGTKRQG
jgi:PKD repeat protein